MPTTQSSLIDQFYASGIVPKQRFVETFGSNIDTNVWTKFINTTGTLGLAGAIDEGYDSLCINANGDWNKISFTNVSSPRARQFNSSSSTFISITKVVSTSAESSVISGLFDAGLNIQPYYSDVEHFISMCDQGFATNFYFQTSHSSTVTSTSSGLAKDSNWHKYKGVLGASNCIGTIDGANTTTISTNLPTGGLEPVFYNRTQSGATVASHARIKYFEAYNQ